MAQKTTTGLPTIGDVIRAWRKFRGLRSIELAEKAGVRSQYLSEIEHNRTLNPREEYLEKLALALEVPLRDIYGRQMPPEDGQAQTTPDSKQGTARQGHQQAPSVEVADGHKLRRRRGGALASPPIEEPSLGSDSVEATTVSQDIDEALEGLSQEECNRLREILVSHARQMARLIKVGRGG